MPVTHSNSCVATLTFKSAADKTRETKSFRLEGSIRQSVSLSVGIGSPRMARGPRISSVHRDGQYCPMLVNQTDLAASSAATAAPAASLALDDSLSLASSYLVLALRTKVEKVARLTPCALAASAFTRLA